VLLLVIAQCLDREGGQAQDGLAGGGLEGADDQQLAAPVVGQALSDAYRIAARVALLLVPDLPTAPPRRGPTPRSPPGSTAT
jgi:hypothetical protein